MKTLLIDNEPEITELLKDLLKEYCPDVEVVGTASGVLEGIAKIKEHQPDLIFLDVEMDDGSGFDLINNFTSPSFQVIFVTAHNKYAIDAFKVSALDYLLKPIDSDDLIQAVNKAKTSNYQQKLADQLTIFAKVTNQNNQPKDKIVLKTTESVFIVKVDEIVWCSAEGSYTAFHMLDGKTIITSKHLKEYERLLQYNPFLRIHRSTLVNLQLIERYDNAEGNIVMNDGQSLPVSVSKESLLNALDNL